MIRISLALSLALFPALALADPEPPSPSSKQLVVVSFDGAHDNALWEKSLAMARRTGAHFTYFLSCTFLMTKADGKQTYRAPGQKQGRSNVGFAQSREEIAVRVGHIWQAHREGHDLGSHACGHFDGKGWSKADWEREFSAFRVALAEAWKKAGKPEAEPEGWADFAKNGIKGFRAPYLSLSDGLVPALEGFGFSYDASLVTKGPGWPSFVGGLPRFGLPLIPEGPSHRPVIGMDYNLFVRHSMGVENKRDSARFEERTLAAFRNTFRKEYEGERIPLQLGFHFVEMNGGAYWRALDRFLSETCSKPEVACVSYAEALPIIEAARRKADRSAF
ncbi:polysaccharide deacetylase [Sinorhizobium meliloti]|uniref:polysaccharide deacetylase family protein n=1 Tax=Rhizobium meliloti TaxID=382 RepID=UPI0004124E28|nr:polysaccharide deacetylase [Sinorhizobium meliloti]MDE3821842.1 polysaccharide deacetylase [Sinorhizobium meliloti]MDE4616477.1 polysaccharide deacetylase [Sinorhizobium meliloti]RVM54140.1 polysaccharide deacetylase [Sinorhizobium meliloti]RVN75589.1 polysaccharide deacetylase [Sinorhizobium meliloti]